MSRALVAVQVILTTANTAYNLATLVRAIASEAPGLASTLLIEADAGNTAGSKISVGDSSISSTRYGFRLGPGDAREWRNNAYWTQLNVMPSADGLKLNVEVTG